MPRPWRASLYALRLADGNRYPLGILEAGSTRKLILSPAIPGAHPVQVAIFDDSLGTEIGSLSVDASGKDLELSLTADIDGSLYARLVDLGNSNSSASSFGGVEGRDFTTREEQEGLMAAMEVDEEDFGDGDSDSNNIFDFDDDPASDAEDNIFAEDFDEEEQPARAAGTQRRTGRNPNPTSGRSRFDDDYIDRAAAAASAVASAPRRGPGLALQTFGLVCLGLAFCFGAAYLVFALLKGPDFPTLDGLASLLTQRRII